jgi:hypothetical protein
LIHFFAKKLLFIISATYTVINKLLTIVVTIKIWRNLKFSAVSKKLCDEGRIRNQSDARIPLNRQRPRGSKFFQPYSLSSLFDDYFNFQCQFSEPLNGCRKITSIYLNFLPYKPGAPHPVASAPIKALMCFCLFGLWPKIQATRSAGGR